MRTVARLSFVILGLALITYVSLRVEFGGQTLWERVSSLTGNQRQVTRSMGQGPPMEEVSEDDQRALDALLRKHDS